MDENPPLDPEKPKQSVISKVAARPLVEIMTIVFTLVVAFMVVVSGLAILVIKIVSPTIDVTEVAGVVGNILGTMTAALLGLIAGQGGGKKGD